MRPLILLPAVLGAAILAMAGWTWWASEAHLGSFSPPPAFAQAIPTDAQSIAFGRHLAQTRGCMGCHGQRLEGEVFHDGPLGERAIASNLSVLAKQVSPALLERAIRHGIDHKGRALYSMPSYNFAHLRDRDVAALIAFLRATPAVENRLDASTLGLRIRWALATGADAAIPTFVPQIPALKFQADPDLAVRRGEYLAMTSCNECHGFGLRGDNPFDEPGGRPPDLVLAGAYSLPDFTTLMRTGKAAGNRELGLMGIVARGRFVHWTDREVADLHAFFKALAAKAT